MAAKGTRLLGSYRVSPHMQEGKIAGSRITCGDGREFLLPQYPKRIRDVKEGAGDGEVVVILAGGSRRVLREAELMEACVESSNIEPLYDQLVESGEVDEAWLEEAFLSEADRRGGASEAEMRAKAASYPAHAGGIGSSKREDIGHGKGRKYPPGFQHIRNALIRQGKSVAEASMIAYGALRKWSRGGGKVKPETRAKAAKVLGELQGDKAKGDAKRAKRKIEDTRESATNELRDALRARGVLEAPLAAYLASRGDSRPVSEDPASLREAAQRAVSGHGPLRARSTIDQRVLDAQTRALKLTEAPMEEATPTTTSITVLAEPVPERKAAPSEATTKVFVKLPPEKGTLPTVVVNDDMKRVGEVKAPRELEKADLGDLQEQAVALYDRTAMPTREGRNYLLSAGRVEITGLLATLREAFAPVYPHPGDPIGEVAPIPGRLPNGEAPPADVRHTPEQHAYADAMLRRTGVARDGRSNQGDYLERVDYYEKPLMVGEPLSEAEVMMGSPAPLQVGHWSRRPTKGEANDLPEQAARAAAAQVLSEAWMETKDAMPLTAEFKPKRDKFKPTTMPFRKMKPPQVHFLHRLQAGLEPHVEHPITHAPPPASKAKGWPSWRPWELAKPAPSVYAPMVETWKHDVSDELEYHHERARHHENMAGRARNHDRRKKHLILARHHHAQAARLRKLTEAKIAEARWQRDWHMRYMSVGSRRGPSNLPVGTKVRVHTGDLEHLGFGHHTVGVVREWDGPGKEVVHFPRHGTSLTIPHRNITHVLREAESKREGLLRRGFPEHYVQSRALVAPRDRSYFIQHHPTLHDPRAAGDRFDRLHAKETLGGEQHRLYAEARKGGLPHERAVEYARRETTGGRPKAAPALDPRFRHHPKLPDVHTHADRPAPRTMVGHELVSEYDGLRNRGWTSFDYGKSAAHHRRDMAQIDHNERRRALLKKEMDRRKLSSEEEKPLEIDHAGALKRAGIEPTPEHIAAFKKYPRGAQDLRGLNEMSRSAVQAHWQRVTDSEALAYAQSLRGRPKRRKITESKLTSHDHAALVTHHLDEMRKHPIGSEKYQHHHAKARHHMEQSFAEVFDASRSGQFHEADAAPLAEGRTGRRAGKFYASDVHGYDNLKDGKPRSVRHMNDEKLAHFEKHPDTHPELRKRVKAEIKRRKGGGAQEYRKRPRVAEKEEVATEAKRKRTRCPACSQPIPGAAGKCPACGESMPEWMGKDGRHVDRHHRKHGHSPAHAQDMPDNNPFKAQR